MENTFQLGLSALRDERLDEAINLLEKASKEENDQNPKIWNAIGVANRKKGQYIKAETCFENALMLDPGNSTYEKNLEEIKNLKISFKNLKTESEIKKNKPKLENSEYRDPIIPLLISIFLPGVGIYITDPQD